MYFTRYLYLHSKCSRYFMNMLQTSSLINVRETHFFYFCVFFCIKNGICISRLARMGGGLGGGRR